MLALLGPAIAAGFIASFLFSGVKLGWAVSRERFNITWTRNP